jgi:hypothetical protein
MGWNKNQFNRLSVLLGADIAIRAPHFFLGRHHWRIHCIEHHFVVIGPRSAAPSLHWTVPAQNVSRHANARYSAPSSDCVRDNCMRHLLPHAPHRILCSLVDRAVIQARRRPSPARGHDASSHVVEGVKRLSLSRNALPNTSRGHHCCRVADRPPLDAAPRRLVPVPSHVLQYVTLDRRRLRYRHRRTGTENKPAAQTMPLEMTKPAWHVFAPRTSGSIFLSCPWRPGPPGDRGPSSPQVAHGPRADGSRGPSARRARRLMPVWRAANRVPEVGPFESEFAWRPRVHPGSGFGIGDGEE